MRFASLKSAAAAAILALAVGAGGFAVPTQAASLSFNFGGGGMNMGPGGVHLHFGDPKYFSYCLDDNGIENRLERRGWDHVHVIRHNHDDDYANKVWVVAQDYKGDWYMMRVDRCTHQVDRVRRVHSHNDHGNFDPNSFHFSFSF